MLKDQLGNCFVFLYLCVWTVHSFYQPSVLITSIATSFQRCDETKQSYSNTWSNGHASIQKTIRFKAQSPFEAYEENEVISNPKHIPKKVTQSLDLLPLITSVSRHCTTLRGKRALLNLIDPISRGQRPSSATSRTNVLTRRNNLYQYDPSSRKEVKSNMPSQIHSIDPRPLLSISKSAVEAQEEYIKIGEAMEILATWKPKDENAENEQTTSNKLQGSSPIPPIYGFSSSPWETNEDPLTDDDEWLQESSFHTLDLENIIQAEQIVKRLIECRVWAKNEMVEKFSPSLAQIGKSIEVRKLDSLHKELEGAVVIRRENTIADLDGSKRYSFELNESKFPQLVLLRKREREIMDEMDKAMKNYLQKMNSRSKKAKLTAFEMDSRLVIAAPRDIANSVGVVRGISKKGNMSYVEPQSLVETSNKLSTLREDLSVLESEIQQRLSSSIFKCAVLINSGLDVVARLDTIFARAAFGVAMNGVIPSVEDKGIIDVKMFAHPLLTIKDKQNKSAKRDLKSKKVVPIDLKLGQLDQLNQLGQQSSDQYEALIISGPNGGGKTLAMKSFGLAATMCKLGIPIPVNTSTRGKVKQTARVDFFANIFTEVGDQQSVLEGESTLISRLNGYSEIIQQISSYNVNADIDIGYDSLILLDELGGGTDPVAGAALAQAILEKMLNSKRCRVVSTTHSLQLKSIPLKDNRFQSAAVLLSDDTADQTKFKLPSFRLSYGSIGDSYGLGAASRCIPALPDDVMKRASDLIIGQDEKGEMIRNINDALENEREVANKATLDAQDMQEDARLARDGTIALARAYQTHFARLENRLETIFEKMQKDHGVDDYEVVGNTLSEVRLLKREIKSDAELLAEKGLKSIPSVYAFTEGQTVVIVKKGEWEGMTASVVSVDSKQIGNFGDEIPWNEVTVLPTFDFNFSPIRSDDDGDNMANSKTILTFRPNEVALWDYYDYDYEIDQHVEKMEVRSVHESNQRLNEVLTKLDSKQKPTRVHMEMNSRSSSNENGTGKKSFTSAHERKMARAQKKKANKNQKGVKSKGKRK